MRKLFVLLFICFTCYSYAQDWTGNISGTIGIINFKARFQYELPIDNNMSTGVNLNYYFVNWTGPLIEPFFRLYRKKDSNSEGWFLQGKLGYGNLKSLDEYFSLDPNYNQKRWSTFGGGIAVGNKFFITDVLTIEILGGLRIYSGPNFDEDQYDLDEIGEDLGWALTTGFPLDLQMKIGYQF
jgi:hypothetical protein